MFFNYIYISRDISVIRIECIIFISILFTLQTHTIHNTVFFVLIHLLRMINHFLFIFRFF